MEPRLKLITDGLGLGDITLEICRKHLAELVESGRISDSECRNILSDIDRDVNERRIQLMICISSEIEKLISIISPKPEDGKLADYHS
jgi:polyhydroxyalkanoate synthesis regulator phasin